MASLNRILKSACVTCSRLFLDSSHLYRTVSEPYPSLHHCSLSTCHAAFVLLKVVPVCWRIFHTDFIYITCIYNPLHKDPAVAQSI